MSLHASAHGPHITLQYSAGQKCVLKQNLCKRSDAAMLLHRGDFQ